MSAYLYIYACVHVCSGECACIINRATWLAFYGTSFFKTESLTKWELTKQQSWLARDPQESTFLCFPSSYYNVQLSYLGSRDCTLGPHAFKTNTSLTEPSLSTPLKCVYFCNSPLIVECLKMYSALSLPPLCR